MLDTSQWTRRQKAGILVLVLIPLALWIGFSIWIFANRANIQRQQLYLQVGKSVVKNWESLSEPTRKEIEDACNPIKGLHR